MTDNIKDLKDEQKIKTIVLEPPQEKSVEIEEEKDRKDLDSSLIAGLVLIGIGGIFLLTTLTDFQLDNWWALFILIPALTTLGNAFRVYRNEGRLGKEGRGSLMGGIVLLFICATFLFGFDWGSIWPVFLIIGGVGVLLNAVLD